MFLFAAQNIGLLSNDLSVLSIFVKLPQPPDFPLPLLLSSLLFPLLSIEMELHWLVCCPLLNCVIGSQNLVTDLIEYLVIKRKAYWSPPVVFESLVPAIMFVILVLVKPDVDHLLPLLLLYLVVISWGKRIYVHQRTMRKDLVVYQRRKFLISD